MKSNGKTEGARERRQQHQAVSGSGFAPTMPADYEDRCRKARKN